MIAVSALLVVALVWMAFRRSAWSVAVLGIAVGIFASGPVSDGIRAGITAGTSLANSFGHLM